MDRFLKRRASSDGGSAKLGKRSKLSDEWGENEPKSIVAWNCNGLTARIRAGDTEELKTFITSVKPDVLFLSEVRVAAANDAASRKPGPHTKWYRNRMRDNDKKSGEDAGGIHALLRSDAFSPFKTHFSLANSKYAGTAVLLRKDVVQKPIFIRYNLEGEETDARVHDTDGRVIFVGFPGFCILHTYVPNNGWGERHFSRRKAWDDKVLQFVQRQKQEGKRLLWVGDLNIAPEDSDLSHPQEFRRQIGEELVLKAKATGIPVKKCNVGQPGCTDAERTRFHSILEAGALTDAYQQLHGESISADHAFSWRGTSGRGMRIDHCIASDELMPRIKSVSITGHGTQRVGFMGSDHSPVLIQMSDGKEGVDKIAKSTQSQEP